VSLLLPPISSLDKNNLFPPSDPCAHGLDGHEPVSPSALSLRPKKYPFGTGRLLAKRSFGWMACRFVFPFLALDVSLFPSAGEILFPVHHVREIIFSE